MMNKIIRSPIFYMGNKLKLMPQLLPLFPKNIDTFYDIFGAVVQSGLNGIKNMANSDTLTEEESQYIEVVPATPISNEEEVYDHI